MGSMKKQTDESAETYHRHHVKNRNGSNVAGCPVGQEEGKVSER